MIKTITCICCPKGCLITLDTEKPESTVNGNACAQGFDYALGELLHPMRTISSTAETLERSLSALYLKGYPYPASRSILQDGDTPHYIRKAIPHK